MENYPDLAAVIPSKITCAGCDKQCDPKDDHYFIYVLDKAEFYFYCFECNLGKVGAVWVMCEQEKNGFFDKNRREALKKSLMSLYKKVDL